MKLKSVLVFNQSELDKLLKRSKKEMRFSYKPDVGFVNGFVFLADGVQLREKIKQETMVLTEIQYWENNSTLEMETVKNSLIPDKESLIPVTPTDIYVNVKHKKPNMMLKMFHSKEKNFLIDTKYSAVIEGVDSLKLFTNKSHLRLFAYHNEELVAVILGVMAQDKQRKIIDQIKEI